MIKKLFNISKNNNLKKIKLTTKQIKLTTKQIPYPDFIVNHYQNIVPPTTRYIEAIADFKKKYNYNK